MYAVTLLAHQGGWDELLLLGGPALALLWAIGWSERRRARRKTPTDKNDTTG